MERHHEGCFEAGDRVMLIQDHPDKNRDLYAGMTGTVCDDQRRRSEWVSVRWDEEIERGHDCGGRCDKGHGWNVDPDYLGPVLVGDDSIDAAEESAVLDFLCA